jgi:acetolactate synthase-1/2/3 large subunit
VAPEPPVDPPTPGKPDLTRIGTLVANARKPALIAGLEARLGAAPAALKQVCETLACPVLTTYKAKGVLPEDHGCFVGLFTGGTAEAETLAQADLIILFGLDPVEAIPGAWPYRAAVLDLAGPGRTVSLAPEANLLTGELPELADKLLAQAAECDWTAADMAELRDNMAQRIALTGGPHTAFTAIEQAQQNAPAGCRLTVDAGAHMFSALAGWRATGPFDVLKSNGLSTMGYALPAAIASSLAAPDKPVLAVTGDGGLMMCLSELATAVERKCRIVVLVLNDAALSLIDIKQQQLQHKPVGVRTARFDFAGLARALGCSAWSVGADQDLAPVLAEAFAVSGPALIDLETDPSGYGDQLAALRD